MTNTKIPEPNPLNLFGIRESAVPPEYFEYTTVPSTYNIIESLHHWIRSKLKGRYYIGKTVVILHTGGLGQEIKVGFEDPKELSYFILACPHLKYT